MEGRCLKERVSDKEKQKWKKSIKAWKESGMSAAEWCRQNRLTYSSFFYWKMIFDRMETPQSVKGCSSGNFLELEESAFNETGVVIEFHGILIRLAKHFDSDTLARCLLALK